MWTYMQATKSCGSGISHLVLLDSWTSSTVYYFKHNMALQNRDLSASDEIPICNYTDGPNHLGHNWLSVSACFHLSTEPHQVLQTLCYVWILNNKVQKHRNTKDNVITLRDTKFTGIISNLSSLYKHSPVIHILTIHASIRDYPQYAS